MKVYRNDGVFTQKPHRSPVGYDLSVKEVYCKAKEKPVNLENVKVFVEEDYEKIGGGKSYTLGVGHYHLIFNEGIKLPDNVCGQIQARSSIVRAGCFVQAGLYEPGFSTENIGCFLRVFDGELSFLKNARLVQIILHEIEYNYKYQGDWQ